MKCVICNSQDITRRKVEEEIRKNSDLILVPVEVLVCEGCGERYYDRRTMKTLEDIEQSIKEKRASLQKVGRVLRVS
ncbi:YgiT-type zinc finger protein [Patescibacteria group bacterium]|nr:YgiT-type zinc finger protein [Patescibacteria group bacterium]